MSRRLVETLERALADTVQQFPREASVLVQFKAGDLADLKDALAEAKAALEWHDATVEPAREAGIVLQPAPSVEGEGTATPGEEPPA